jgi:hypothetical protein
MAERRGKPDPSAGAPPSDPASPSTEQEASGSSTEGDRVNIGAVSLVVPADWRFYPLEDRVVGRPTSNVGVLQIKVLPSSAVSQDASHEMFMSIARDMSGYELSGTGSDPAKERIGCCLAGGESFRSGHDFVRVWYHHRPEGLAVASFSCKAERIGERSVAQLIRQGDKIIASIRLPSPTDA